ncbi:MAG: type II and III secretion system protein family protein [Pseudomonadota bacterium]
MTLKNLIRCGCAGLLLAGMTPPAWAQQQGGVLRVMQGTTSDNITVDVNRAVVLESTRTFEEVSVANPAIADVATLSDRTIYILGRVPGRTTLTLLGPGGVLITNVDIRVAPDIAEFKERLAEILPREEIHVRTANDGIVLSGTVSGARKLAQAVELAERYAPDRVTNLMTVGGTQQVMLKVRFAEMSRSIAKNLGVSLGVAADVGAFGLSAFTGSLTEGDNSVVLFDGDPDTAVTLTEPSEGVFGFGFGVGPVAFDLIIETLESKGLVRTLAEPNIIAISGQDADFLAGGEFPIPVSDEDGITIEFRPFGVQLLFKPTVIDEDLINLEIGASVSAIDPTASISTVAGVAVPGFSVRRAVTTVEMRDGQSFAIAGLLTDDFSDIADQVPFAGDIPVLGALFRSAEFTRSQTELVVFVTPHLVTPVDGDALSAPTDRIALPNEAELFLLGRTEGRRDVQEVARQDFEGSYGYVME